MPKAVAANDQAYAGKGKLDAAAKGASQLRKVVPSSNKKVKFCMYHLQGVCKYTSDTCAFAHSMEDMNEARRTRKGQGTGGKKTPPGSVCSEPSTACSEFQKPSSTPWNHAGGHRVHDQYSAGKPSGDADAWPELKEPMFVETQHPNQRRNPVDTLSVPAMVSAMSRDPEQYFDYNLWALPHEHLHASLVKPTGDVGSDIAAALMQLNGPAMQQVHPDALADPSNSGRFESMALSAAHGFDRGSPGLAAPTFYTMPNPFIGMREPLVADAPAFDPPPGLRHSCALGA